MISTDIEQKLIMGQKYIVSTTIGTYFRQVSLRTSWHGGVCTWAPAVRYL